MTTHPAWCAEDHLSDMPHRSDPERVSAETGHELTFFMQQEGHAAPEIWLTVGQHTEELVCIRLSADGLELLIDSAVVVQDHYADAT